ncbi:MAG: hypothetical protein AAFX50_00945 [Acidobacteriota bacterium]
MIDGVQTGFEDDPLRAGQLVDERGQAPSPAPPFSSARVLIEKQTCVSEEDQHGAEGFRDLKTAAKDLVVQRERLGDIAGARGDVRLEPTQPEILIRSQRWSEAAECQQGLPRFVETPFHKRTVGDAVAGADQEHVVSSGDCRQRCDEGRPRLRERMSVSKMKGADASQSGTYVVVTSRRLLMDQHRLLSEVQPGFDLAEVGEYKSRSLACKARSGRCWLGAMQKKSVVRRQGRLFELAEGTPDA